MKSRTFSCLLFSVLLILIASSCSATTTSVTQQPETPTIVPATFTATPVKTIKPTETITYTVTPDFNDTSFQLSTDKELQDFVPFELNHGKSITDVSTPPKHSVDRHTWISGRAVDFDGDGEKELFLTISIRIENQDQLENIFWIARKSQGTYKPVFSESENAYFLPKIEFFDNFNNNGLSELIFTRTPFGNGAGTDIFIAYFDNSNFVVELVGQTDLILNTLQASPKDKNGIKNLIIKGFQPGWGSSGPGRTVEEIYSVTPGKFMLLQSHYLPDNYRIHVLQDAQIAYNSGDEKLAVELWKQAAYDKSLENFPSTKFENDVPENTNRLLHYTVCIPIT